MLTSSPSRLRAKRCGRRLLAKANFPLSECLRRNDRDIALRIEVAAEALPPAEPSPRPS
jgi:hypothetical protein